MRRVTISNSLQKARDTSRVYELLLFDDSKQTIVSENDNVTVKIGNRTGFLLDIEPGIANGAITIDSARFADLPADDYRLEIWMKRDNKLYIYPDEKQITLRLSSTLKDITVIKAILALLENVAPLEKMVKTGMMVKMESQHTKFGLILGIRDLSKTSSIV